VRVLFSATKEGGGEHTTYHIASLLGKPQLSLQRLFRGRGLGSAGVQDAPFEDRLGEAEAEFRTDIDPIARVAQLELELAQERERRQLAESEVRGGWRSLRSGIRSLENFGRRRRSWRSGSRRKRPT
jgi:hypothetical protein